MSTIKVQGFDTTTQLGEALDLLRPKLDQLTSKELLPINVEPIVAASTVQAVALRLSHLREQFVDLPRFDIENFDLLDTYALALIEANVNVSLARAPTEDLEKVVELAKRLKEVFLCDVNALVKRGHIRVKAFKPVRGRPSYRNLVNDLLALTTLLRKHVTSGTNQSAVSVIELNQAEHLCLQLIALTAARKRTPLELAKATLDRQKAFTLMSRAYDQVRKAVHFLRWEKGDAAKLVPALSRGRKGVRKKRSVAVPASPSTSEASELKEHASVSLHNDSDPFLH